MIRLTKSQTLEYESVLRHDFDYGDLYCNNITKEQNKQNVQKRMDRFNNGTHALRYFEYMKYKLGVTRKCKQVEILWNFLYKLGKKHYAFNFVDWDNNDPKIHRVVVSRDPLKVVGIREVSDV